MKRKNYKLNRRKIIKSLLGLGAIVATGLKLPGISELPGLMPDEESASSAPAPIGNKFTPVHKSLDFAQIHLIGPWSG